MSTIGIVCCVLFLMWLVPLIYIYHRLNRIDEKLDEILNELRKQ